MNLQKLLDSLREEREWHKNVSQEIDNTLAQLSKIKDAKNLLNCSMETHIESPDEIMAAIELVVYEWSGKGAASAEMFRPGTTGRKEYVKARQNLDEAISKIAEGE